MSWLSKATGIHISPHGASLSRPDPIGTLKDIAHNPLPLLGALAIPGVGGLLGSIPGAAAVGGALSHVPGVSALGAALGGGAGEAATASAIPDSAFGLPATAGAAGGGGGGLLGTIEGLAGKAGHYLAGNNGMNALGIAQGINTALQQKKANDYAKQALGSVEASYNQRAPLRSQGVAMMQQAGVGNPYATGKPVGPLRIGA